MFATAQYKKTVYQYFHNGETSLTSYGQAQRVKTHFRSLLKTFNIKLQTKASPTQLNIPPTSISKCRRPVFRGNEQRVKQQLHHCSNHRYTDAQKKRSTKK